MKKRGRKLKKKIKSSLHRCRYPNHTLFISALIALIVFLLFELTFRIYDLYRTAPDVDIPSHFLAGIALGLIFYWLFSLTNVRMKRFFSLTLTLTTAIIWEVLETLQEMVMENPNYLRDYFFWDGFWDIIITSIGGLFSLQILYLLKNKISSSCKITEL